jgi:thioesterase domain-containing protein
LLAADLLLEIEQIVKKKIPPSIVFETGTVRRLVARLEQEEILKPQSAVRIGGDKGCLFHFFHGDLLYGGLSMPAFAAMLGPQQPILAIPPHGIAGEPVPESIEAMGKDRLSLVLQAQPCGPFVLGGHCNGALVAFETARSLVNAGHSVELVVMIDPPIISVRRSAQLLLRALDWTNRTRRMDADRRYDSLERAWKNLAWFEGLFRYWQLRSWTDRRAVIARRFSRLVSRSSDGAPPSDGAARPPKKGSHLHQLYTRMMIAYYPAPLNVPVLYGALRYGGHGWRRITPRLELIDNIGQHRSLREDPTKIFMAFVRDRLNSIARTKVDS